MTVRCEFDRSRRLLFIFVEGTISIREALKTIVDTVADGRFDPRYDVLADSMGAQYVGPVEAAWAIAELLRHSYQEFETRIAIAAADRDLYDLGRLAAVRLREQRGPQMEVFSTLSEAREWVIAD